MASFFGFIKWTITTTVRLIIASVAILFLCAIIPFNDMDPKSHKIPFPKFVGPLKPNRVLSYADHLFTGDIKGPESLAVWKADLYSGLENGDIIRITEGGKKFTKVANVRPPGVSPDACRGPWDMDKCGRPLGMRFDSRGTLYVIDAYRGLLSVDVMSTGDVKVLLDASKRVDGRPLLFLDDLTIDEDPTSGDLTFYMSDASGRWDLKRVFLSVIEHEATGRVVKYELATRKASVVLDGLAFPNGVQLTDDRQAILIATCNDRRITKLYIRGPKAGKSEPWAVNLPGEPDNIRRSADKSRETYWVAIAYARDNATFSAADILSDKAAVRRGIMRLTHLIAGGLNYLADLTGLSAVRQVGHQVESGALLLKSVHLYGMILEMDSSGRIVQSLHSPDAATRLVSEAREVVDGPRRTLYLGSVANDYVGKLVLD